MLKQQLNKAALYLRLSRDDGGDVESNSIGNQRAILERYATESDFDIIGEYVDDGISGTTFERPNFKRMIEDIEGGKITIVLCKDLSRLGRNNAMVAYFTEIFFIEHRVRFIALNDGIDRSTAR
jgi:DNA invertase Pin-like site-specific DNA recombinase